MLSTEASIVSTFPVKGAPIRIEEEAESTVKHTLDKPRKSEKERTYQVQDHPRQG